MRRSLRDIVEVDFGLMVLWPGERRLLYAMVATLGVCALGALARRALGW